jgi:MFS superfamily sulfate permease-like transporter
MELVSIVKTDVPASLVVFLVALPLCLGIALASGAPPVAGLLSGIIGGLVVATLGGSPMQVSGPANGLIVLVLLITQEYGLAVLGVVVLAAGTCQLAAGLLRVGQVFRAIPPAIIHGLMTGFAVIIFASQFHVMLDDQPQASALKNLLLIPEAIVNAVAAWDGAHQAASIGVLTIAILLLWKPLAPGRLASVPASLVAVGVSAAVVALGDLSVARVPLPDDLVGAIRWLEPAAIGRLREWPIIEAALVMAFLFPSGQPHLAGRGRLAPG